MAGSAGLALTALMWLLWQQGIAVGARRRPAGALLSASLVGVMLLPPLPAKAGGGGAVEGRRWLLNDPLGTASVTLLKDGQAEREAVFEPFGAVHQETAASPEMSIFAGHHGERATGLIYMQARWQDPETGSFLSVDPMLSSVNDPQSVNAYAYVRNNPVQLVDPEGKSFEPPDDWELPDEFFDEVIVVHPKPDPPAPYHGGYSGGSELSGGDLSNGSPVSAPLYGIGGAADGPGADREGTGAAGAVGSGGSPSEHASSSKTRKTDKHGKSEKALKGLRKRLERLKEKQKTTNKYGTRAEKRRLKVLIKHLQRNIDKLKKGTEHWRRGNPKSRGTYPWMLFDFQIREFRRMLGPEQPPPDMAMRSSGSTG